MTLEDQIRDEKLQYDISTEAAEISVLSSGKTDKYEYLTGEETSPFVKDDRELQFQVCVLSGTG